MSEHNGGDHVTWRDIEAMGVVRWREIDQWRRDIKQALELAKQAADEAREVARTVVLKHDEEKNHILAEWAQERATYATKKELDDKLNVLSTEFHTELEKVESSLSGDTSRLGSTVSTTSKSVGELEKYSSKQEGRDLGRWGAVVTILAVALSILGGIVKEIIFS